MRMESNDFASLPNKQLATDLHSLQQTGWSESASAALRSQKALPPRTPSYRVALDRRPTKNTAFTSEMRRGASLPNQGGVSGRNRNSGAKVFARCALIDCAPNALGIESLRIEHVGGAFRTRHQLFAQDFAGRMHIHGTTYQIALHRVTAKTMQHEPLSLRLYAFGEDISAESMTHANDRPNDLHRDVTVRKIHYERSVNLNHIECKSVQLAER